MHRGALGLCGLLSRRVSETYGKHDEQQAGHDDSRELLTHHSSAHENSRITFSNDRIRAFFVSISHIALSTMCGLFKVGHFGRIITAT
jgi:hypothetical protein